MFKIETGIEMPPVKFGPKKKSPDQITSKYPILKMEVGQSFFVAAKDAKEGNLIAANIAGRARTLRQRGHWPGKLAWRSVVEEGQRGIRFWRTE